MFRCDYCNHEFYQFIKIGRGDWIRCPQCGAEERGDDNVIIPLNKRAEEALDWVRSYTRRRLDNDRITARNIAAYEALPWYRKILADSPYFDPGY